MKVDFDGIRIHLLNRIQKELADDLFYHSVDHTLKVEEAVINLAKMENLSVEDTILVRTAALFHDSGFTSQYINNEVLGVKLMRSIAPGYGYTNIDMVLIENMILATSHDVEPKTLMEKIMCDADHYYLGSKDYHNIASKLRKELKAYGRVFTDPKWLKVQIDYLKNTHRFYTASAIKLRLPNKKARILELEKALQEIS